MARTASSAPSSSSSASNKLKNGSILSFFSPAPREPKIRELASGSASGSQAAAATPSSSRSRTSSQNASSVTPAGSVKAARRSPVASGSGAQSPVKTTPRQPSPLKQSVVAKASASVSSAQKARMIIELTDTTNSPGSSSSLEVSELPAKLPTSATRDLKGKGKAVDRHLAQLMDDEDEEIEDSQDQHVAALLLPNGGCSPTKASPTPAAPVVAKSFYSPSRSAKKGSVGPTERHDADYQALGTQPRSTPSKTNDPALVSSPSSAARRSSRSATAAATLAISKSYADPYGRDSAATPRARAGSARASTPRAASVVASSSRQPTKLTKSALSSISSTPPRSSRRTTGDDFARSYIRDPSGSPLSSLGPSPIKQRAVSFSTTAKKRKTEPYLDFLVPVRGGPKLRRERSQTVAELDDSDEEDRLVSSSRRKSISPRKKPVLKEEPETGDLTDLDSDKSDSADESEDEGIAMALARAAARRAEGKTLLTTSDPAGPLDLSSAAARSSSPEIRRSSRAAAKDEGRIKAEEKRERERARMKNDMGLMNLAGSKGKLSIAALQREREEKHKSGRSADWDEGKRLMEQDGDEYASDDSASSDEKPILVAPESLDLLLSTAANVIDDPDEELAKFTGSPQKREQKQNALKRAGDIAITLKADVGRVTREGTDELELQEMRGFWRSEPKVGEWQIEDVAAGEWSQKVAKAIQDARQDPKSFPSALLLFSSLKGTGILEEHPIIARCLLSLICHPTTPSTLANRANSLLDRLVVHAVRFSPTAGSGSPVLTAADICSELQKLGAKKSVLVLPKARNTDAMQVDGQESAEQQQRSEAQETDMPLGFDQQRAGVLRLLSVVQGIAGASPSLFSSADVVSLVVVCVRMAVDPTAAPIRNAIEITLDMLFSQVAPDDSMTICHLFEELVAVYHGVKSHIRLEVLRALPHTTKSSKMVRKWLAYAFLVALPDALEVVSTPDAFLAPPPLDQLQKLLETPGEGPFKIVAKMDDAALYHHSLIIAIALTDLTDELYSFVEEEVKKSRKTVESIASALIKVEGRIRTDIRNSDPMRVRAKNALTRLHHALTYQVRSATGKSSGFDFTQEEEAIEGNGRGQPRPRLGDGPSATRAQGQTTLNFAPVAKTD